MDHNKNPLFHLLPLLLLLLLSCHLFSLDSAPPSRAFALRNKDELRMKVEEGGFEKGRMEIEVDDYPGSGPNSRHDPKNPGKP